MTADMTAGEATASSPAGSGLVVDSVWAGYGRTTILRDVSLALAPNSVTALIGPNGAGKSTLLKAISGLLSVQRGSIAIDGAELAKQSPSKRARRGMCLIPEGRAVYKSLTVRQNLTLQCDRRAADAAVKRAIEAFPRLGERLKQPAGTLSGGEQQMLALSAAYVRDYKYVMVDEASLGLAPVVVDIVFGFLQSLAQRGVGLLLVDQYATRALAMAQYGYVLRHGEIVEHGPAADLLAGDVFAKYMAQGGS